jgi:hypothetical protein
MEGRASSFELVKGRLASCNGLRLHFAHCPRIVEMDWQQVH